MNGRTSANKRRRQLSDDLPWFLGKLGKDPSFRLEEALCFGALFMGADQLPETYTFKADHSQKVTIQVH